MFLEKIYDFMHFEKHFKVHKIIYFQENRKKNYLINLGRVGLISLTHVFFYLTLSESEAKINSLHAG